MAIYYCAECDNYIDNDWFPCEEYKGELICPDCALELTDENEEPTDD